jgi:hypothetical protein
MSTIAIMFIVSYDLLSDMPISPQAPITFSDVASLMAHSCPLLVYGVKLFSCPVLYDAQRKVGYNTNSYMNDNFRIDRFDENTTSVELYPLERHANLSATITWDLP